MLSRSRQFQMRAELSRRRKAERALAISEKRFRLTFENAAVGIGHVDLDGHFLRVNDRFCEITGYTKASLESTTFGAITHPDDFAEDWGRSRQLLAGEAEQYMIEKRYRRPDGSYVPVHLSVSLMRDETGLPEHFISVVQDISDRKKAEEALVEANRRKDEFLATLSHELRNPLAPISSGLELLRMVQDDPVQVDRILSTMERQTHQLTTLVDDLMDLSRIAKAKLEVRKTHVLLRDVVEIAVDSVRSILVHNQHEFHLFLPESDIYLNADPQRLAQVLINLLSNAAKYTSPGGHVELRAQLEGERVLVTVSDNGIGIPKAMQSQIFEMFSQVKHPLEKGFSGLGIGLTLVKSLVRMHGGEVEVFSEGEGQGAEFRVWLPVDAGDAETESAAVSVDEAPLRAALRVLIVDDNRAAAEMLAMGLGILGHDVRLAHDGLAGLDVARQFLPNVIFLDLGMPVLNGYDTARRIRKEPWGAGVKLIALSGWGHDSDRARTAEAGFDGHLVKPASLEQIQKLLIQ
jgi:PAS domain S-box-containing protein